MAPAALVELAAALVSASALAAAATLVLAGLVAAAAAGRWRTRLGCHVCFQLHHDRPNHAAAH